MYNNINTRKANFEMIAKTFFGLEDVLAQELRSIGAKDIIKHNRAISFIGNIETMYKANYLSRTALRILKPIIKCKIQTPKALYKNVKKYEWEKLFSLTETFAIDTVVSSEYFKHSKFVALKVKDAIVDRFRDEFGERPSVDVNNPTVRISVHIFDDTCTISLDSSGESLHKRGYRTAATTAPLNEALAAGMILISGWDKESEFIDGMCGSGTIPIEAALIALNIPPGYLREEYGFMKWKDFDADLFEQIKNEVVIADNDVLILGADIKPEYSRLTKVNAKNAGVENNLKIFTKTNNFNY